MNTLAPYLNFNGNTAEAMKFYQSIFGGKLDIQKFGDMGQGTTPEEKNRTIHATLTSDNITFMASDGRPEQSVVFGDSVNLSLMGSDEAQLSKYFAGLSVEGKVTMPLAKQFWGDTFGTVIDKYGIHWMINISAS